MFKRLMLAAGLLSLASTSSFALLQEWEFKPAVGMDFSMRAWDFDSGFGEEHFREHYPDLNIYLAARFHKYLGLEGGYEQSFRQQKQQFYYANAPVLGFRDPANPTEKMYISDAFMHGWHINLTGFYPICPKLRTELTGLLGVGWLNAHYTTVPVLDVNPATPVARWDSDTRSVLRLGIGLRQMITDNFGLRLQAVWEDTSKLEASIPVPLGQGGFPQPSNPSDFYTVKSDSSYLVGVGFFFQIA